MNLTVLVPFGIFAKKAGVSRIIAETREGSFGLLPHRLDCVAALTPGILMYETEEEGEVYVAVESPRGELGCYLVSDGGPKPYRMHIRGPSFVNLQTMPHMMYQGFLADEAASGLQTFMHDRLEYVLESRGADRRNCAGDLSKNATGPAWRTVPCCGSSRATTSPTVPRLSI